MTVPDNGPDGPTAESNALERETSAQHTATIEAHGFDGIHGHPAAPLPTRNLGDLSEALWLPGADAGDTHVAFRGRFTHSGGSITVNLFALSAFVAWFDGDRRLDGPLRFAPSHPEYQALAVDLPAGTHTIAIHVRSDRLTNRISANLPGLMWCRVLHSGGPVEVRWRCRQLTEHRATGLRVSPLLGWVEWADQWIDPAWRTVGYDDATWTRPEQLTAPPPGMRAEVSQSSFTIPEWPVHRPSAVAGGSYRDTFTGYELDDLASQFALADLAPGPDDDIDGCWVRYDLGRIRIGAVDIDVETTSGGIVTIGYGERLSPEGRVVPVVPLSAGPTRMVQRYRVPPGRSTIEPIQTLGGRWIEVHVRGEDSTVLDARFRERDSLGDPIGAFTCSDQPLNDIWKVGVDTLRSSAEDALVDSVRERGEWLGDVVTAAMEIASVSHGDLRLVERALVHAAASARSDGLVAGCGPGELIYLGTYAAQWVSACLRHAELAGTTQLLRDLYAHARANVRALYTAIGPNFETGALPWSFVDWGYDIHQKSDLAVLCHVYGAGRAWQRWRELVSESDLDPTAVPKPDIDVDVDVAAFGDHIRAHLSDADYHTVTLASFYGLVAPETAAEAIESHLQHAFPFNPNGSRLRSPTDVDPTVATPYFMNYALPVLLDAGRAPLVADLWKRGWGWMLDKGATTWWEVFDDRWSQCHYWAGAPTWQMTRHLLGVRPELHRKESGWRIRLTPGHLAQAAGRIPIPDGGWIDVTWSQDGDTLTLQLTASSDITVLTQTGPQRVDHLAVSLTRGSDGSYEL